MDGRIRTSAHGVEIALVGKLTFDDYEAFHACIESLELQPNTRLTFDLSALEFVDSAGLGMFLIAQSWAGKKNVTVDVTGAYGLVKNLMHLVKFDMLMKITTT